MNSLKSKVNSGTLTSEVSIRHVVPFRQEDFP